MQDEFYPSFTEGDIWYRLNQRDLKHELLYKAIGIKHDYQPLVFDATAGWGRDAIMIAAFGCTVRLFERHPIVAQRLRMAMQEAEKNPHLSTIVARMQLLELCSFEHMQHFAQQEQPDVIYCDPMFEQKRRSLPKKDLQALQALVTIQDDPTALVTLARQCAKKRVVVKRAKQSAPYLAKPNFQISGKSHHFDIYQC